MIHTCAKTDIGQKRLMNQDYIFASEDPVGCCSSLFVVADGMGGEKAGDYASRFTVETLVERIGHSSGTNPVTVLEEEIRQVNYELYQNAMQNIHLAGTGTTLVAAVLDGSSMYVANVGDSRLYLVHGQNITQITRDHSYVEEMVSRGALVRGSKAYLAKKNIITRAIGAESRVQVDFFEVELFPKDIILLCSDGLTNMLSDEQIRDIIVSEQTMEEKADLLIQKANENGGSDNISVILTTPRISEVSVCY
mgnify:CR=1 FL=1